MHKIILIRHGKAEEKQIGQDDYSRALTQRGIEDVTRLAEEWKTKLKVDYLLYSSAKRTEETAAIWMSRVSCKKSLPLRTLYLATADEIWEEIQYVKNEGDVIAVVGHNPGLEDLASRLKGFSIGIKTSDLILIEDMEQGSECVESRTTN